MPGLIFPLMATLHRVDPTATMAAPGYDPDFAELRLVDGDGDGVADGQRAELPPVEVPCQVEPDEQERLGMTSAGDVPQSRVVLVFHTRDLIAHGFYSRVTGVLGLRPGDRLAAIRTLTGEPVWVPGQGRGLYLTDAKLAGWGLGRVPRANLVLATFEDRPAVRRGA